MAGKALDELQFENRFTHDLPADPETANAPRQVQGACYSRVKPTPVARPHLVAHAREMVLELDLDPTACAAQDFAHVFAGNRLLDGMDPFAMCYGGHQFGNWWGSWATAGRSTWARQSTPPGSAGSCSSKAPG